MLIKKSFLVLKNCQRQQSKHGCCRYSLVISKGCNPIVGLSSVERVDDILKATVLKLTEEDIKYLEEPYVPKQPLN